MKDEPLLLHAAELSAAASGQLIAGAGDVLIRDVAIDSRRVKPGDLFVAFHGSHVDGHQFVGDAVRRGAVAVVVSDRAAAELIRDAGSAAVIVVPETKHALQQMAGYVRRASGATVVAITGSVGKTTTKELTAAGLAVRYRVVRNQGNLNNDIGVPLSLFALVSRPEIAVIELGMNHAGEIRTLVGIAAPDVRLWTNVAEAHAANFDSIDAIADAKAEILDGATPETTLVANADDPRVMSRSQRFPGRVMTFGIGAPADVRGSSVRSLGLDGMEAVVEAGDASGLVRTPLLGLGNVANLLAAVTVALRFQVPLDEVLSAVARVAPQSRRGERIRLRGVTVVDDSYNSNPRALQHALTAVQADRGDFRRRVAVVGEMLELGAESVTWHRACGRRVAEAGFDLLVAVGGAGGAALAAGAREAGMHADVVRIAESSDEAADVVARLVRDGDLVLIKGSRGIHTDRIVDRLKAERG